MNKPQLIGYLLYFIAFYLVGYLLHILLALPALYAVPWIYEHILNVSPACGLAINYGLDLKGIEGCVNVADNMQMDITGVSAGIIAVFFKIINDKEKEMWKK